MGLGIRSRFGTSNSYSTILSSFIFVIFFFLLHNVVIDGIMIQTIDETEVEGNFLKPEDNHLDLNRNPETLPEAGTESKEEKQRKESVSSVSNQHESVVMSDENDAMEQSRSYPYHQKERFYKILRFDSHPNAAESEYGRTYSPVPRDHLRDGVRKSTEKGNKDIIASNPTEVFDDQKELRQEMDKSQTADPSLKKQKYSSLLYTFGVFFNSFLSEFGDLSSNQDIGYNSTGKESNSSLADDILNDTSATFNATDTGKKTRFQCALRNVTENTILEVKIVNSTELLEILNSSKNQKMSPCVLVMFYAPWCYFCAKTAPYYNALARTFPQLNILAVDTSHFSYLNARFGTVAVPNVMLFHSRSAVRYNHTVRDLDHFIQFVTNNTGLEPNKSVNVETWDYEGPLSSQVVQKRDWLLWLAWVFVISCSTYGFVGSLYGQAFIAKVRVLWQEHQHIE